MKAIIKSASYDGSVGNQAPKLIIVIPDHRMLHGKKVHIQGIPGWYRVLDFFHGFESPQQFSGGFGAVANAVSGMFNNGPYTAFAINMPSNAPYPTNPIGQIAFGVNVIALVNRQVTFLNEKPTGFFGTVRVAVTDYRIPRNFSMLR